MRPEFGRTQYLQNKKDVSFAYSYGAGTRRGSVTVLLGRRRLDLESHRRRVRVPDLQSLGDLNGEWACTQKHNASVLAGLFQLN